MSVAASGWSIRHPVPTAVAFLVLILAGLLSFSQLGIDDNPVIDLPIVAIETQYVGASPQALEAQFTKKIENAVAGLGDVNEIYSQVSDGYAYTAVRFNLGVETGQVMDNVRDAINRIRGDLAPYAESMTIQQLRYDDGAVLTYAIRSDTQSVEQLSELVDRTVAPALMSVSGVSEVERIGGVDREISVELNASQLAAYGISAVEVSEQVKAFNRDLSGGQTQVSGKKQSIRMLGKAADTQLSLNALRSLNIVSPSGAAVPLSELATVTNGLADIEQGALVDSQPVVSFSVYRSNGSLLASVEEDVVDKINQLQETFAEDVSLQLVFTRAADIREAYKASIEALLLGSVLAVVVVGCFLRNWRTTLITAVALPLSVVPTFIVIKALGYSLNSMTLLALTLAVGNLVDDAIVEIENIERHISMGKSPVNAAVDSGAEVGLAVVTTTATVVAVFIPVAFMGGIPGQFFQPFGITVAVSTLFSTLVARFVTPLLAAKLLLPKMETAPIRNSGQGVETDRLGHTRRSVYQRLLEAALRHRLVTLSIAIAIFCVSLTLIPHIPTGLASASNTDLSRLHVALPPGTTFARSQAVTQQLSDRLLTHPDVQSIYLSQTSDDSDVVIRLKPKGIRTLSRQAFEQQVRSQLQALPDIRFSFDNQSLDGGDKALSIVLKGENPQRLNETATQLAQQMREISGLVEVSTSTGLVKPELLIEPDSERAADLGITLQDIAATVTLATLGDRTSQLSTIDTNSGQVPIRTRLAAEDRRDLNVLRNLPISNHRGQVVPLSAVATITTGGGPAEIQRFDRARQITLGANLENISLGQGLEAIYNLPLMKDLPEGISEQTAGGADILQDVFSRFAIALSTAVVMIYAVLVLLYNSFIYPLAVMSSLPLSIGGTFVALLITQKPLDLYALIGIVLLMGLVTKNAILLVDYALQAKEKGLPLKQAVIASGVTRMRPILMTSISTVAGMVPIALELGAGGEVRSPMAIAVIGGFTTATLLTLIVVPVCFTYIAGLQQRIAKLINSINQRLNSTRTYLPASHKNARHHPIEHHQAGRGQVEQHMRRIQATPYYSTTRTSTYQKMNITTAFSQESRHSPSDTATLDITKTISPAHSPHHVPQYTIACIENDFSALCSLHDYFSDTAFSLVSVDDPITALSDLASQLPSIILLTTSMPGVDAFEVCDRLRKSPTFRTIPILLLVPKATWRQRLKAKWYGASGCIEKPLDRTQVLVKLFLLMV